MKLTSSPRLKEALAGMGIHTWKDVLFHFPFRYEEFTLTKDPIYHDQQRLVLQGIITTSPQSFHYGQLASFRFSFKDHHHHLLQVTVFNRPYLAKKIIPGTTVTLVGKYDTHRQTFTLSNFMEGEADDRQPLKPVYRLPEAIEAHVFHRLVKKALLALPQLHLPNPIESFLTPLRILTDKSIALRWLHEPESLDQVNEAIKVFKYEEAWNFYQQMYATQLALQTQAKLQQSTIDEARFKQWLEQLPYQLTNDQRSCIQEIVQDLQQEKRMYRLLQGDVGSGKTLVASAGLYANALRRKQGALMVPTDALAKQHIQTLKSLLEPHGITVGLLVGGLTSAEKKAIKERLIDGTLDVVVGTHSLFSADTDFFSLGLVVIDEQHRFGVQQRELLSNKGKFADVLMMSATPIPRSLAMTLYANMDVSTLNEFPFKQRDVKTKIVEEGDALIDYAIQETLANNKRVYIVAPKIADSDHHYQSVAALYDHYQKRYPQSVKLLHGKLDQDEKDRALELFKEGRFPILVSTTVIEVGIDVKAASLIIVHDSHAFGLATLHQLRGRIGRDGSKALCLLVVQQGQEEQRIRLQPLVDSLDGFYIAEQDLRMRGPGELTGEKQSGLPAFQYLHLLIDQDILNTVKSWVFPHDSFAS